MKEYQKIETEKEIKRAERWWIYLTLVIAGITVTLPFVIHLLRG